MVKFIRPFDLEKTFNEIKYYIQECEIQRDHAIKQVEEYNKDEEIQILKNEISELKEKFKEKRKGYTSFIITPEENELIKNWKEQHVKEKHNGNHYAGAIGGRYSYRFVPTSIGEIGEIVCDCGEKFCFRELT